MKSRIHFALSLRRLARLSLILSLASLSLPAVPAAGLAGCVTVLESTESVLRLEFAWSPDGIEAGGESLTPRLEGCALAGEPGGPMLPRYRGLIALPPGREAVIDWRLGGSRRVEGRPRAFPTIVPGRDENGLPTAEGAHERTIADPALFAAPRPISARLETERRLRDLRVVDLIVDPAAWSPERGLTVATGIEVTIRFVDSPRARAGAREACVRPEKIWDGIYAGGLLNGDVGRLWRDRYPARALARADRTRAALRLEIETNGIHGLAGDDLIAHGIPAGTPLAEIALFRRSFDWSEQGEPLAGETGHARFFLDEDGDALLDAGDTLVFVGRDLATMEGSPDPIQWFSAAGVLWVAVAPDLVVEMTTAPGWETLAPSYTVPDTFRRTIFQGPTQGTSGNDGYFLHLPTSAFYNPMSTNPGADTWNRNLHFNKPGYLNQPFTMTLRSPGYAALSTSELEVFMQSFSTVEESMQFSFELDNANGQVSLPTQEVGERETVIYAQELEPDWLVDGETTLDVAMYSPLDTHPFCVTRHWRLTYDSWFHALDDSLHFNAAGLSGPTEIRVERLANPADDWLLIRTDQAGPTRILLDAPENQAGSAGDYELRFRGRFTGDETWWLLDRARLRAPTVTAPGSIDCLTDPGPYDVLVISADEFHAGMERWETYREAQGLSVKRLAASDVWETFGAGSPGDVALRNAVRFAYQQWGTEALLLVGDCSEDARGWNRYAAPCFLPGHSIRVFAGGLDEILTLDQWVTKFEHAAWPALIMGRLSVGTTYELTNILDKIECYESYTADPDGDACGAGDWRKRILLVADDSWRFDEYSAPDHSSSEDDFTEGQEAAAAFVDSSDITGEAGMVPFHIREITHPYYEANSPWPSDAVWTSSSSYNLNLKAYFRSTLNPVAMDTMSAGYSAVVIQGHGNASRITHEWMYSTGGYEADQMDFTNYGRPFVFCFFGCHGNAFAAFNEGNASRKDCVGEKTMYVDGTRGAVLSYASEGYEYLTENLDLGQELLNMMFWRDDYNTGANDIAPLPDWRFGALQLAAEIRDNNYNSAYRYTLLGDPLTRIDMAPPRIKVWVNRERLPAGAKLPALSPGAPLTIDAVIYDETAVGDVDLTSGGVSLLTEEPLPGWFPNHAEGNTLDSLIAATDTLLVDLLAPLDSLSAATTGRARSWYLHADLVYDPEQAVLSIAGRDNADRLGEVELTVPRTAVFYDARGDSLVDGQWIDAAGELTIDVLLPEPGLDPADFLLLVDGEELEREIETVSDTLYRMTAAYDWAAGEHRLTVVRRLDAGDPISYGGVTLVVDGAAHVLDALIFPNPFRDTAMIRYLLTRPVESGTLSIYTLTGRRVYRAELTGLSEGERHAVAWDGRDAGGDKVANGVYIVQLVLRPAAGDEVVWRDKIVRMR